MRSPSFVMIATVVLGGCASAASAADPKPSDATLGLKPPAEARRPLRRRGPPGLGQGATARPPPTGRSRTASSPSAGRLDQDREDLRRLPAPRRVQRPRTCPRPRARRAATAASTSTATYELQVLDSYRPASPRTTNAARSTAGRPLRQRLQASAPVADLRRHLPRGQASRTARSSRRPASPSSRTASRPSTTPRSRRPPAATEPRKARTGRSCSRTMVTRYSTATSGSNPSTEVPDVEGRSPRPSHRVRTGLEDPSG